MSFLITILAFALAIGVLVSVHEYGHYWVARRCGVKVLVFSIGFGKPLLTWQRGEVQWQLAAIPLGGYVKMLDEREAPVAAGELDRAFNRQSPLKRIAIVLAGPLANFALAIIVYWGIFLAGVELTIPRIGTVTPHSVAAAAGFQQGDTILTMQGEPVASWAEARLSLIDEAAARRELLVSVRTLGGVMVERTLDLRQIDKEAIDGDIADFLGLSIVVYKPVLGMLTPDGVAARAGLRQGDELISLDGQPLRSWAAFAAAIKASPAKALNLQVKRDGKLIDTMLTPATVVDRAGNRIGRVGAGPTPDMDAIRQLQQPVSYGPVSAFGKALQQTWSTSALSLRMLWRMVMGNVSYKQLSGPVAIAGYAGQSAKIGLRAYLEFLCLISISLGVLNLLPVPVLDGGHLMYYSAELLRGRPVSERVMELSQRVGVGLLAALMIVALFNDITRLVGS